jgi:predicted flap endonuclease-1-like 5' DNA nuclease
VPRRVFGQPENPPLGWNGIMMTTDCTALDLPLGIGKPALRALEGVGICTLDDVAKWQESELAALHGVGPKALGILKAALEAQGLSFRAR